VRGAQAASKKTVEAGERLMESARSHIKASQVRLNKVASFANRIAKPS
jgi:hypothetical protein